MKGEKPEPNNPHNNAFFAKETLQHPEQQAKRDGNLSTLDTRGVKVVLISKIDIITHIVNPIREEL
jgi:hypothetical protein